MAREIQTRWKIHGTLTAETPIHVGGVGGDADTDLALAVNGGGNYYIPGTSLAGALRDWMGRSLEETHLNDLWGFQEKEQGQASFIIIDDAEINLCGQTIEIREGVSIDRATGTASDQFKYSRAILPKGVSFPLNITLDCKENQQPDDLWQLLLALEKGEIRIGAAKTRGLGKVKLTVSSIHEQTFDANNIFNVLLNGGQFKEWAELKPQQYDSPAKLSLEIQWTPKDPVMVKSEGEGIAVDILPLVSQANQKTYFVIPGSSIKGVLRTQAERIVRTVCNKSTPDSFSEQVKLILVDELFGKAEENKNGKPQGKMSALSVDDCYAEIPMKSEDWSAVEKAGKAENGEFYNFKDNLRTALDIPENSNENPFQTLQPAMHVAVDRWTGGAADGMLYSVLEPIGVEWGNIAIHLDLARLKKYDSEKVKPAIERSSLPAAIALLLLVLRDFAHRKIPIGYGTNRGMGTVEVQAMNLNCSVIESLPDIEKKTAIAPDLSNLGEEILNPLNIAWQNWIDSNMISFVKSNLTSDPP
ncbi:MAG: RAMP superfamily CRISPR-associated protein [Halothece sp.]